MLFWKGEAHECLVRDQQGHEQGESISFFSAAHNYGSCDDAQEIIEA
jgi:hypothetical protein